MSLVELLAAGGDLATIAVFVMLWKFDRRILKLEINALGGRRHAGQKDE